jgi:hypothetical protein
MSFISRACLAVGAKKNDPIPLILNIGRPDQLQGGRMKKQLIACSFVLAQFLYLFAYPSMGLASDLNKLLNVLGGSSRSQKRPPANAGQKQQGLQNLLNLFNKPARRPAHSPHRSSKGYLKGMVNEVALTRKIEQKSRELERRLQKVFMKIRAYQAIDGAIWVGLGRSYAALTNDLTALEKTGGAYSGRFIENTRLKQNQQMELMSQVTLDAASGISDAAETISLNHQKNQNLRVAVKQFIATHPLVGVGFKSAINEQNAALDDLLRAYMTRLGRITRSQLVAAKIFQDISREFQAAEGEMRLAIRTFNQEGALVTVQAAKHLDSLYAMARQASKTLQRSKGDWSVALSLAPKIQSIFQEINRLSLILGKFRKAREKLARESTRIREQCDASALEINQSKHDIQDIGTCFQSMWVQQVAQIHQIAAQRRVQVQDLAGMIRNENQKNQNMASRRSETEAKKMQQMADQAFGGPVFD